MTAVHNMFRSLFNYKATYPAALSFSAGDVFLEIPGAKADKNWYFVTDTTGKSGFVPQNYMESLNLSPDEVEAHVIKILDNIHNSHQPATPERRDTISHLELMRKSFNETRNKGNVNVSSLDEMKKQTGSQESLSSIRSSSKKRAAPQPPGATARLSDSESNSPRVSPRPSSTSSASPAATSATNANPTATLQVEVSGDVSRPGSRPTTPRTTRQPPTEASPAPDPPKQSLQADDSCCLRVPADGGSLSHQTSLSSVSTDSAVNDLRTSSSDLLTVTYRHPQESCRARALELVEVVRGQTGLSYQTSTSLLTSLLADLVASQKDLNVLVPSLKKELEEDDLFTQDEILGSGDYNELTNLFNKLTQAKDDEQQRNWMLHEDESIIQESLCSLVSVLTSAKLQVSVKVIREYKYYYVQNLVEYFQMETRWNIRRNLIETLTTIASIDSTVVSLMLNSVLPLELVQTMYENPGSIARLKHSAILLTIIFSQGEDVPVHYMEQQLGATFVDFILDGLENPQTSDFCELGDVYMGLLASYNLQFKESSKNLILESLVKVSSAKVLTEKLLLLLNREEDPAQLLGSQSNQHQSHSRERSINSVHKLVLDIFSREECISLFYTNDLMVLIDIIARQLCDLGPGMERYTYLEMAHLVLSRSGYDEHLHRLADLKVCLQRIEGEEGQSVEKLKVKEIVNELACFSQP